MKHRIGGANGRANNELAHHTTAPWQRAVPFRIAHCLVPALICALPHCLTHIIFTYVFLWAVHQSIFDSFDSAIFNYRGEKNVLKFC